MFLLIFIFSFLFYVLLDSYKIDRLFKKKRKLKANGYVVITGTANGLGRSLSYYLGYLKYNLILIDIERDELDEVCKSLVEKYHIDVIELIIDLSNSKDVELKINSFLKTHTDISIIGLINNAGIWQGKNITNLTPEDLNKTMQIDFISPYTLIFLLIPTLSKSPSFIVNISSITAIANRCTDSIDYICAKSALLSLHNTLKCEFRKYNFENIHLLCVLPYLLDTELFEDSFTGDLRYRLLKLFIPELKCEYVVKEIWKCIEYNEELLILPNYLWYVSHILEILPLWISDFVYYIVGSQSALDNAIKRKKKKL